VGARLARTTGTGKKSRFVQSWLVVRRMPL